jgi:hypothetical protein
MFPLFVSNQNCEINFYIYSSKLLLLLRKQVGFDKHSAYRINFLITIMEKRKLSFWQIWNMSFGFLEFKWVCIAKFKCQ